MPNFKCLIKMMICFLMVFGFLCFSSSVGTCFFDFSDEKKEIKDLYDNALSFNPKGQIMPYDLGSAFNLGTKTTEIQRDVLEKKIKDKYVLWSVEVYEIEKLSEKKYVVSVLLTDNSPGMAIGILIINEKHDIDYLMSLQTGSKITFFGKIKKVSMRSLVIDPAIIFDETNYNQIYRESKSGQNQSSSQNKSLDRSIPQESKPIAQPSADQHDNESASFKENNQGEVDLETKDLNSYTGEYIFLRNEDGDYSYACFTDVNKSVHSFFCDEDIKKNFKKNTKYLLKIQVSSVYIPEAQERHEIHSIVNYIDADTLSNLKNSEIFKSLAAYKYKTDIDFGPSSTGDNQNSLEVLISCNKEFILDASCPNYKTNENASSNFNNFYELAMLISISYKNKKPIINYLEYSHFCENAPLKAFQDKDGFFLNQIKKNEWTLNCDQLTEIISRGCN